MQFIQKVFTDLQISIPELKNVKLDSIDELDSELTDFYGYTDTKGVYGKYKTSKNYRTLERQATDIYIRLSNEGVPFPEEILLCILLHEIAHCLTPHVEIKQKKGWIIEHHSQLYYGNLTRVNREAKKLGYDIKPEMLNIRTVERYQRVILNFHC
jgi:hypothetical protein